MGAAWLITTKDLRQRIRDKSAIIFALIAPLGLAFIFSQIFGGIIGGDLDLELGVVDLDGGPVAAGFTEGVLPGLEDAGVASVATFDTEEAARRAVEDGEIAAAFVLPTRLSSAVATGQPATLQVLASPDADVAAAVAEGVAGSFAGQVRATQLAVAATLPPGGGDAEAAAAIAERVRTTSPAVTTGAIDAERRELDPITYLSAGMAVFFLFFTVQFGVTSLLEERREGTLPRLFAAPISRMSVYGGKAMTSAILGVVSMAVLIVATDVLIGAEWGDPIGVALLVLAGVASATGVMAVLALFAKTAEQANVWQSVTAVVLGMLGGTFFPIGQGGGWLSRISDLTPHRWFMRGLADLAGGGGPLVVLPSVAAMLVFAVVGFAAVAYRLSRRELA